MRTKKERIRQLQEHLLSFAVLMQRAEANANKERRFYNRIFGDKFYLQWKRDAYLCYQECQEIIKRIRELRGFENKPQSLTEMLDKTSLLG